jgi:hypothetical protein
MGKKYTNISNCKILQNLPELGFLVSKYAIWQPCCVPSVAINLISDAIFLTYKPSYGMHIFGEINALS